jgi:peroxiredoxin
MAFLVLAGLLGLGADSPPPAGPTRTIDSFRLPDPRADREVALADLKDSKAVVVVFLGTECPVNNAFLPILTALAEEYGPRGVAFLGISSNRQDTAARVAEHARKHNLPFPILKDAQNKVADQFGAQRTPEAFVLDGQRVIRYQGRIDDQFGIGYQRPGKPTRRDLAEALDEVLAGKAVRVPTTPVAGCLIARETKPRADGSVTFARHISRILQKNCQECHRPGQIGPMSLLTYDDAVSWAGPIREAVGERRMPPWYADPKHGKFLNDRSLSSEDRTALLSWIEQGTPRGDDRDLPAPRVFPEGWVIGKPDVIFTLPQKFEVPAQAPKNGIPYKHFRIPTGFNEDRWVERAEAQAGDPSVVHHIVVFIHRKGEPFREDGPGAVLCGTAPGDMPMILKPGLAKKIPAGSDLIMQMHYTPTGKATTDLSRVGLIFAKQPPEHRVLTKPVHPRNFFFHLDRIPAGAENYLMETEHTFREDTHIIGYMPHMHLRGKDFLYEAIYPDGKKEVLLSVPRFQFGWQSAYVPVEPTALPKGSKLHCVAHFDNSAKNPNNPDPSKAVYWGDQTWEEMMIGWIDYYVDGQKP